jgi:3-oxoacid CoA-transferase subunit A
MIKHWLFSGDTHGYTATRIANIKRNRNDLPPEDTAIVFLGDVGLNYYLNKKDKRAKELVNSYGYLVYCVRGNHEARPFAVTGMQLYNDPEVNGFVYREPEYPNIRYLIDTFDYTIGGQRTLIIGGAYSVDKYYRLEQGWNWFEDEQLTPEEKSVIADKLTYNHYDLILAHTCPYSWRPTDLFLAGLDQSKVDSTMELWLEELKDKFKDSIYLFGHYHDDRLVREKVEMYYTKYDTLENILVRWDSGKQPDYYYPKDPNYYMGR